MEARPLVVLPGEHRLGILGNVEVAVADFFKGIAHVLDVVLGKIAGVRPRIGEHLVLLVERLGDLKRAFRGEWSLPLKGGKIVKLRGDLRLRLFFLGDRGRFALAAILNRLRLLLLPKALGAAVGFVLGFLETGIDPLPEVGARSDVQRRMDLEISLRFECLDLLLTCGKNGQGRRLHPACGGDVEAAMAGIEAGEGAGGVQADQPIGLRAALCGIRQRLHLLVAAEILPGGDDGSGGHRLHPQALDRLLDTADLHDVAENKLPFPAGVAGIDDEVHILAFGEFEHFFQFGLRGLNRIEIELLGDGREDVELPWKFLAVRSHRHAQLHEMADCGSDDRLIVFVMDITAGADLVEFPQGFGKCLGEIVHDGRFLGYNQCFSHKSRFLESSCGWRGLGRDSAAMQVGSGNRKQLSNRLIRHQTRLRQSSTMNMAPKGV